MMLPLTTMFVFGPYSRKKFGNPGTVTPRYARASPSHRPCRSTPSRPTTFIGVRNFDGWNPVP